MKNGVGTSEQWGLKGEQSTLNCQWCCTLCVMKAVSSPWQRGQLVAFPLSLQFQQDHHTSCDSLFKRVALSPGRLRVALLESGICARWGVFQLSPQYERERQGGGLNPTFSVHLLEEVAVLLAEEARRRPWELCGLCKVGVWGTSWDRALPGTLAWYYNIFAKAVAILFGRKPGEDDLYRVELLLVKFPAFQVGKSKGLDVN